MFHQCCSNITSLGPAFVKHWFNVRYRLSRLCLHCPFCTRQTSFERVFPSYYTPYNCEYGNIQLILLDFLKMLQKFKLVARGQLQFFVGANINLKKYLNFTITFPTMWRCTHNFFKVLQKFKMAAMDELFLITLPMFWKCAGDFTEV